MTALLVMGFTGAQAMRFKIVALSLCGVLDNKTAFSHWGDPTVILFMAMFIVGEATFVTGFADKIGALAMRLSKGKPRLLLLCSMVAVGSLSTVLSDTGTTVVAMPMIMAMFDPAVRAAARERRETALTTRS